MADTLDFLLEIGTEEMPSAPLINASKQLPKLVVKMLDEAGLAHGDVRVVSSPRRLAAIVSDVACATEAVHEVKRGPKAQIAFDADGNPTKAAAGFARKCGIDASELTRKVDEDGNEYVFAERNVPSEPAMPILSATTSSPPSSGRTTAPSAGAPSTRPSYARFAGSARSSAPRSCPLPTPT